MAYDKRSMKLAVLSDLHIDSDAAPASWDLAKRAIAGAVAEKPDHVVIAGDLFDSASAMRRDAALVKRSLRRAGLWHRDRLTVVVGNHDVFRTPHHGPWAWRAKEVALALRGDAQDTYNEFSAWAGELARPDDRLSGDDDLYPIEKRLGHVRLWAANSTAATTHKGGNGYWPKRDDGLLRAASAASHAGERRVLAIHNAPFESEEQTLAQVLRLEFEFGFPRNEYRRLRKFIEDAKVETLVCGHIHTSDEWSWTLGKHGRCNVHLVGRTNELHDDVPSFGLLEVPERGRRRWRTIPVA